MRTGSSRRSLSNGTSDISGGQGKRVHQHERRAGVSQALAKWRHRRSGGFPSPHSFVTPPWGVWRE